jgi:fructuronate reductase
MGSRKRLSEDTLRDAKGCDLPRYDRAQVTPGIVHLGVGAFHRAHQAVYVDDCLAAGETDWGIVGASLRSADTRDALSPQDGLYTLAVQDSSGDSLRVIGSERKSLLPRKTRPRSSRASPTLRSASSR